MERSIAVRKAEARESIMAAAYSFKHMGLSSDQFKNSCINCPSVLPPDVQDSLVLVPEVLEHVIIFVWSWRR